MTVLALKDFTLYGEPVVHGSPLKDGLWDRCNKRLRDVLTRGKYVTFGTLPSAEAPVKRKRGRPRKGE